MKKRIRSIQQDIQEIKTLKKNSKSYNKHQIVLDKVRKLKKRNNILEIGCGSGIIVDLIQTISPNSNVFGLDLSPIMISAAYKKNKELIPLLGNALELPFLDNYFDIVIFSSSFHEVFSIEGITGAIKALKEAYRVLRKKGTLILNEGFKPVGNIKVKFEKRLLNKLAKFAKNFKLRKIKYKKIKDNTYELSQWDLCEFLTKYKNKSIKYKFEMSEEHFCFSEKEYLNILRQIGFKAKIEEYKLCRLKKEGFETKDDIAFGAGLVIGRK